MNCPFCRTPDTKVIDSRTCREGFAIRRRRVCAKCDNRFTTYEQVGENPVILIKKDSSRVPFDREKIRIGIQKACYKRPVSSEQIEELAARIEARITQLGEPEVSSERVGDMVMDELRGLDQVAYVRFASVYREFKDVSDFAAEIKKVTEPSKRATSTTGQGSGRS